MDDQECYYKQDQRNMIKASIAFGFSFCDHDLMT
jgi:hypothetical protein